MDKSLEEFYSYPVALFMVVHNQSKRYIYVSSIYTLLSLCCAALAAFNVDDKRFSLIYKDNEIVLDHSDIIDLLNDAPLLKDYLVRSIDFEETKVVYLKYDENKFFEINFIEYRV